MKNLILLNRSGMGPDGTSRKGRYSLDPILSRLCLASLICLCMLTLSVGNAWGVEYTYTEFATSFKKGSTSGTSISTPFSTSTNVSTITASGSGNWATKVTACSNSYYSTSGIGIRISKSSGAGYFTLTLSDALKDSTIYAIVIHASKVSGNTKSTLVVTPTAPSGGYTTVTNIANGTLKAYSASYDPLNDYYKLDTIKVGGKKISTLKFGSASGGYTHLQRVSIITQTEKAAAPACSSEITITKGSNPANGTFTISNSGTVCIDGGNASTTVNATPSSHYHLATVTSSGGGNIGSISNNSCTISNISANTTINVTFAADPTYTVTWVAGTNPSFSTQTNYAGTALTDPGTPDGSTVCGSKVFRGWTATPIVGEDDEAPNDLFTSVSGKSIPEGGTTYYAVFATQSGGGSVFDHYEKVTTAPTDWTAHKYVYATADAGYVLTGKASGGNYGAYATMSTTTEMASYEITVENGSTDNYKLKQGGKYISCSSFGNLYWNNSYTAKTSSVNNGDWMFYKPSGTAYRIESPVKNSNNKWIYIDFNSSANPKRFNSYVSGNQTAVYLYKRVETSGYTYSNYATSCGSCSVNPTIGAASLKGSFSLTSVGVTATDWDPGTNCTWDEKGFVWGSSANPTVSNNKVTVNTGTSATWDGALVPSGSTDPTSLSVGNTYHYRAYGKNGKEGATYVYSSDASFTPRSVTCESVTGGTISAGTEVSVSGKTITLTATPDSHFSFGSWTVTNNSTSATITVTNNQFTMPDANVTVTATFNEDAYKTVTFYNNSTNTGITGYTNMKVYVGDTPSEPTLTDGTSGDACDATSDKHYGWSRDTWSGTIDTEAHMTGSPGNHTVYQKGSVPAVVAGDPATISYHAVWAAGSQYWGRLTSSELSGLSAGTELVIVAVDQGYVLQNDLTCSNSVPAETDGKISPTDNIKWTLAGSAGAWQLKSGTDILGTQYNSCAGSGNGVVLAFNLNHQTYSIASSSHATNEFYIKDNACDYGVLTKVSKYDDIRIVNVSSYRSVASAALKLYIKKGSYSEFITNCCSASTLAFAASPYAVIRQDIGGASTTTWAEVDVTFTSNNTTGTISPPDYDSPNAKNVYKLSSWGARATTGGTLCGRDHAYFEVLTQPSGETPGTGKFHVKTTTGQTGQGTYRIAITQASTDESHGNFCETTVYGFVDVTLRDKFVDNVNGNGTVNRDGHGAQLATPTLSEFGTQVEDACHEEGRKLKGWIKETDLKAQYETGNSTRVQTIDGLCGSCDPASDQKSLVVAPGENITTSGATWYAVWAYER